jgi:hypothetical protein
MSVNEGLRCAIKHQLKTTLIEIDDIHLRTLMRQEYLEWELVLNGRSKNCPQQQTIIDAKSELYAF